MKKRLQFSSLLQSAVLLAVVWLAGGCAREVKHLTVGMELNYPPFEMVDSNGAPAGISAEMAWELGQFLGKSVDIQNIPFDGLIPALKTGKIDLILSSMTSTPERAQSIDFSNPYLHTGLCLLVGKGSAIQSERDLDRPGVTVAVKQGTTGQSYARDHLKSARVLVLDKEDACVLEVVQGKADAFIFDQMSVLKHSQQHKDTTRALLTPFQQEAWAIGIRKGNDSLREQVNRFLEQARTNGSFEKLGEKYLSHEKLEFRQQGIPFIF
jgi:polar amino acid transport system substrate-binding protein